MPPTPSLSGPFTHRKRRFEDITIGNDDRSTSSSLSGDTTGDQSIRSSRPTLSNDKTPKSKPAFLVGIDFGTTMTSVSYYKFRLGKRPSTKISKDAIKSIIAWPNAASSHNRGEVPSESLYVDGKYYWGYGAQQRAQEVLSGEELDVANRPIKFTKLFLADWLSEKNGRDEDTSVANGPPFESRADKAAPHAKLKETLEALNKDVRDVIGDYLVEILRHTKAQLVEYESFRDTSAVELALSVPAGWPLKASWNLQEILKKAIETVKFGQGFDLFLVNEPEAASAFALDMLVGAKTLATGETFLVCDAGGGTVDVTTYTIDSRSPFRFSEAVGPAGANCGSVYVNQAMERHFRALLKNNKSLERKGISAEEQLQHHILPDFEGNLKRVFDASKGLDGVESFIVHGVEANESKHFGNNRVKIPWHEVAGWFQESLEGTAKLIREQLSASEKENKTVQKVMLVGGFSQSPTLKNFLKENFPSLRFFHQPDGEAGTLVSRGAVYRAIDKSNGPSRQIMANIGILQIEEVCSKTAAHRDARPKRNPVNKKMYIHDCVNWVIKKGQVVGFDEYFTERLYQVIMEDENWEFSQRVYYSVTDNIQDHYRLDHPNNQGYEEAGMVSVDLTRWKEEYPIPLKGTQGNKYYEIEYDVRMELHGRNLRVSVVYPPGQEEQSSIEICITASFVPGTE